jgi:DNA polymerase-3 subunit gamma/tau
LYYQTLLIGRKELPYAPDRRMGVEMTLLRALAFHPQAPLPEPEVKPLPATLAAPVQAAPVSAPPVPPPQNLPQTTSQVLAARSQLQRSQGAPTQKE